MKPEATFIFVSVCHVGDILTGGKKKFSMHKIYARKSIWVLVFLEIRVARWFLFKPKIQIWANFGGL
jgi:hypothetical protein